MYNKIEVIVVVISTIVGIGIISFFGICVLAFVSMIGHMIYVSTTDNYLTDEWYSEFVNDPKNVHYKKFEKISWVHVLCVPFILVKVALDRRVAVVQKAESDSRRKYNNNLSNKYYKKLYDKTFQSSRVAHIKLMAQDDFQHRNNKYHINAVYDDAVERKIYQDEYVKMISSDEDFALQLKENYKNLYSGKEKSKISNEQFEEVFKVQNKKSNYHDEDMWL